MEKIFSFSVLAEPPERKHIIAIGAVVCSRDGVEIATFMECLREGKPKGIPWNHAYFRNLTMDFRTFYEMFGARAKRIIVRNEVREGMDSGTLFPEQAFANAALGVGRVRPFCDVQYMLEALGNDGEAGIVEDAGKRMLLLDGRSDIPGGENSPLFGAKLALNIYLILRERERRRKSAAT